MKNIIIVLVAIIIIGLGAYFLIPGSFQDADKTQYQSAPNELTPAPADEPTTEISTTTPTSIDQTSIGKSVEGREIPVYHYGSGDTEILFVGGIHGGYSWNTVLLAYEAMDYLEANPSLIPANVKITIIPVLNPDGLNKVVGSPARFEVVDAPTELAEMVAGRFNANEVDLNRNFDCAWQATGKWQTKTVSGGNAVFSEPESQALKNYVETNKPSAVVVWYSAAGGVFSSSCQNGILAETKELTNTYATASGYTKYDEFDAYPLTGDMVNWLAKENIPAISVLLTNHTDIEWNKNKAGIEATLKSFAE